MLSTSQYGNAIIDIYKTCNTGKRLQSLTAIILTPSLHIASLPLMETRKIPIEVGKKNLRRFLSKYVMAIVKLDTGRTTENLQGQGSREE